MLNRNKLGAQHFAELCGINKNTICNYIVHGKLPRIDTLIKIAEYSDVSIDYLLGLTDNPTKL